MSEAACPDCPGLRFELTLATQWIHAATSELVRAGAPAADRTEALASLRGLLEQRQALISPPPRCRDCGVELVSFFARMEGRP